MTIILSFIIIIAVIHCFTRRFMKMFLIKIGKVWSILQKNGLWKGSQKICGYFLVFLKSLIAIRKGDILFITGGVGDSAHYRSHNVAEELKSHGFKCSVVIQDNPFLAHYVDGFKVFIFQKTIATTTLKKIIAEIKKQRKEIIFETDDLIFSEKYLHQADYWRQIDKLIKQQYIGGQGSEILKDDYVKVCTTSTGFLQNKLQKYGKKVFLVPNKICNKELEIANKLYYSKPQRKEGDIIKIGYFSGTISHNKDFATITSVLLKIMEKYKNVKLVLVGPLDVENKLNKFKNRIEKMPVVSRKKHYANIAEVDINISPLEINNDFCQAKSELKFFEAGIVGVPTVATATQVFQGAISDGVDSFVANNNDEWLEKLEKLVADNNFRVRMGKRARKTVLEKYTVKNSNNKKYYNYLRSAINK